MNRNYLYLVLLIVITSCKSSSGVFSKKTAHEQYGDKLNESGLNQTSLGIRWFDAASKALINPVEVPLPHKEAGYFATDLPSATALQFNVRRGEDISIELLKTPSTNFLLFADLFSRSNGTTKFILSLDTINITTRYTVKENGQFIIRLQPELLRSGSYTLTIRSGPSLAFPVLSPTSKNRVISIWADERDGGARSHEGVDIGGIRGTPVIAIGNGVVSSVTVNNLGGKVVFIRSDKFNENWYYAHLDSQLVKPGQHVVTGDIVGLIGNTGNARTTAPHLHFGIYSSAGAIDPLPYIQSNNKEPGPLTASSSALGTWVRLGSKSTRLYHAPDIESAAVAGGNIPLYITGATSNFFRTNLPGGETMFVPASAIVPLEKRIRKITLKENTNILDSPAVNAPVIKTIEAYSEVDVLGTYKEFQLIGFADQQGWILLTKQ